MGANKTTGRFVREPGTQSFCQLVELVGDGCRPPTRHVLSISTNLTVDLPAEVGIVIHAHGHEPAGRC